MKKDGFSLLELLVVLVIMGILLGVAVPVVSNLGQWPLKTAVKELATQMREARETAITHGLTCTITFYDLGGCYRLDLPNGTQWIHYPKEVSVAANNFRSVSGRPTLSFRYTGAPNSGGHIALKDREGRKLYVIVTPVTGRVRIDSNPP